MIETRQSPVHIIAVDEVLHLDNQESNDITRPLELLHIEPITQGENNSIFSLPNEGVNETQAENHQNNPSASEYETYDDKELDIITLYLNEIGKKPLLTRDQEIELGKQLESENEQVRKGAVEELVTRNLKLVVSVASKYRGNGVSFEDLIQYGNEGLLFAAPKYDWKTGNKFGTFATWWIRHKIVRGIQDNSKTIRLPAHINVTSSKIKKAERELSNELGREPTMSELSNHLHIPEEKIVNVKNVVRTISADLPVGEDGEPLLTFLSEKQASKDVVLDEVLDTEKDSLIDGLLSQLSDRDKNIVKSWYGLGGCEKISADTLAKQYGLSRQRMYTIVESALVKFKDILRSNNLDNKEVWLADY